MIRFFFEGSAVVDLYEDHFPVVEVSYPHDGTEWKRAVGCGELFHVESFAIRRCPSVESAGVKGGLSDSDQKLVFARQRFCGLFVRIMASISGAPRRVAVLGRGMIYGMRGAGNGADRRGWYEERESQGKSAEMGNVFLHNRFPVNAPLPDLKLCMVTSPVI